MTYIEKIRKERRLIAECNQYLKENKMDKFYETVKKIKEVENKYIDSYKEEEKKCQ